MYHPLVDLEQVTRFSTISWKGRMNKGCSAVLALGIRHECRISARRAILYDGCVEIFLIDEPHTIRLHDNYAVQVLRLHC